MFRFSNKKALSEGLKCRVLHLIPGEEIEVSYNTTSTGQDILDDVAQQLDLLDKDYYGLKLYDHMQWLDPTKPVVKQTKGFNGPIVFVLRFKYYPAEPALLANESTRYFLYLQLRSDLLEGRLRGDSQDTLSYLIACVLQSEMGNAVSSPDKQLKKKRQNQDQEQEQENYVTEYKFVPNQSEELELASIRLHQSEDFLGLRPADAELNFLKKTCQLDSYGIDPFPVKEDTTRNHFLIGVNHKGILTFQESKMTNLFTWEEIEGIEIEGKLVLVYVQKVIRRLGHEFANSSLFVCRCPTKDLATSFWKVAMEHKYFFTLDATPERPIKAYSGGFLRKTSKLKYVGRVEKDLLKDRVDEVRSNGVRRSRSLMAKTNNGPLWQGFKQQGQPSQPGQSTANNSHLQNSMGNLYTSDMINKTIPASMNYFREDEEDQEHAAPDEAQQTDFGQTSGGAKGRPSLGSVSGQSPPKTFNRKSVLTTKTEAAAAASAIRRGSQIYMDTEQQDNDFLRASIILLLIFVAILVTILLASDADRPKSVSLLIKKLHLEHASASMRQNYYLPLKSALGTSLSRLLTLLDSRLL